jgi:NAD(P)-dependent dehydrogenase (short-subunit alcohol dehydrogenase family)
MTDILGTDPATIDLMTLGLRQMTRAADRIGVPEDIANIVLLVVSDKAGWITGQHISASGGITGQ